ncbi:MAG: NUDIX hydrolase [Acidobacteriota bacterium]|nr:NUDIX hydrolase [Acidobacteriota bacterium]
MDAKKIFEGKKVVVFQRKEWEFVERRKAKEAVAILALTSDGELILTEQYRAPVDARVIDLPAGLIEQYEAEETAWRELEEETGFTCDEVVLLATSPTSPGITSEIVHFYRAKGVRLVGKGGGVGGEDIEVHRVRLADIPSWLESQKSLIDGKIWAGLYFASQST